MQIDISMHSAYIIFFNVVMFCCSFSLWILALEHLAISNVFIVLHASGILYCLSTRLPSLGEDDTQTRIRTQVHIRNRNLKTSKAPIKSQTQGISLFMSAVSNQRGCPIVRGRLRAGFRGSEEVYVCIHICVQLYIHVHTYIHAFIRNASMHAYIHTFIHKSVHI